MTLSVMPSPGDEMYRLGIGLLDGADVGNLARAVAEMATIATAPLANPSVGSLDIGFHGGSLRVGVLRIRGDAVAYPEWGTVMKL